MPVTDNNYNSPIYSGSRSSNCEDDPTWNWGRSPKRWCTDYAPDSGTGDHEYCYEDFRPSDGVTAAQACPASCLTCPRELISGLGDLWNTLEVPRTNEQFITQVEQDDLTGIGYWNDGGWTNSGIMGLGVDPTRTSFSGSISSGANTIPPHDTLNNGVPTDNANEFEFNTWRGSGYSNHEEPGSYIVSNYFTDCDSTKQLCPKVDIANIVINENYTQDEEVIYIRPQTLELEIFDIGNSPDPRQRNRKDSMVLLGGNDRELYDMLSASYKVNAGRLIEV